MRDAARKIDDVDAARQFAECVGVGLAVFFRNRARHVISVTLKQLLELEHRLDAL